MFKTTRTALLILTLSLTGSSLALAQDKAPPSKGKTSEKSPKKEAPKADAPDVVYLDLSTPDAPESDLPAITKKGPL